MEASYHADNTTRKPDILEVIGQRVELRKAGPQYWGRCPFHIEATPSFAVNPTKGVFYCFGCHVGGDVFEFIIKLDGLTFPEAKRALGVEASSRPLAPRASRHRKAATLLATWLNKQHLLVGARCRRLSRQIALADEIASPELAARLRCAWEILADLHDDLANPTHSAELWEQRAWIEQITAGVELEPVPALPPWKPEYIAYLVAHLPAGGAHRC
jgi:hypothetical protein